MLHSFILYDDTLFIFMIKVTSIFIFEYLKFYKDRCIYIYTYTYLYLYILLYIYI